MGFILEDIDIPVWKFISSTWEHIDFKKLFNPHNFNSASNYMFKVNNRNTRRRCEIYSKLTIKIQERRLCIRAKTDGNEVRTHNHLVRKRTLNHIAKFAKWLSVRLRTKWLWVRISLLSLKLRIWRLLQARSSLTFRQTLECEFTLKLVRDMIIRYS